ncbi:MAG TPA: hypothetical protein VFJ47_04950 [Terriglobales bacterium]|nr:hypothetical protein [Terriglobales bacterium]
MRRSSHGQAVWDAQGNYLSHPAGVVHFLLVYVAMFIGLMFAFVMVLVSRLYSPPGGGLGVFDRIIDSHLYVPNVIVAVFMGAFFYGRIRHNFAFWVWVPSLIFLVLDVWGDWAGTLSRYHSMWDTYFGRNCGGTECLYQLFFTMPFYTSVAYALGAVGMSLLRKKNYLNPSHPTTT